jgi:hypothetical protein
VVGVHRRDVDPRGDRTPGQRDRPGVRLDPGRLYINSSK